MGKRNRETKQQRLNRIGRERREYWAKVDAEVFQPQRDSLPDVNDLPTSEPQRPRLSRLAGAVRALRNNDGA